MVSKNSIRSIARIAELSPKAIYNNVDKAIETAKASGGFDGRPVAFRETARTWLPNDERRPPRDIFAKSAVIDPIAIRRLSR